MPSFKENLASMPKSVLDTAKRRVPLAGTLFASTSFLAACEPIPSQQLYIVSVNLKEISNTPYANLEQGVQDFANQYKINTGKTLRLGESPVVMGATGQTDFLVSSILNPDGTKNRFSLATYKNGDGKVQNDVLVPISDTTSDGIDYIAFYPLSEGLTAKVVQGESVEVDTSPGSKDIGLALYGLTLKPGIKMADFQVQLKDATTPEKAREILDSNLSTFFITNPNTGKSFTALISNVNMLDQLVGLLTGVQPALAASEPQVTLTPPALTATATEPPPALTATPKVEPLWNMNQPLPALNSQNATFESNPQGGGAIHFTVEGQRYAIEIPRPEVIDGAGIPIAGEGEVTVKLYPPPSDAQSKQTPIKVAFVDKSGGEMGWYDVATGQWTKRYETLFVRDSWPEFPQISWIQGSLGFEEYEASFGADSIEEFQLTVSGRVKRVYTEKMWYPAEKRFAELTWASVTYDKDGQKTLETILFTDREYSLTPGRPQSTQIVGKQEDYSGNFIPPSLIYQNQAILEAVKSSAFVKMELSFWKDSERDGADFYASDLKFLLEKGYMPLLRLAYLEGKYWDEQRGLARTMIAGNLDRPELKELDGRLQGYSPTESGVRIGFREMWIFVPNSGN